MIDLTLWIFCVGIQLIPVSVFMLYRNEKVHMAIQRRIDWVFAQDNWQELRHKEFCPGRYNDMLCNHLTKFTYEDFYGREK